jgi:hypothetical protein
MPNRLPPLVDGDEQGRAGVQARPEALIGRFVFLTRLALAGRFVQQLLGFVVQPLQGFRQVVRRDRQLELGAVFVGPPADGGQQAEIFAELDAEPLGGGVIPAASECDPEVLDAVEVVADQLVDAVALGLGDRGCRGHGAPPFR